ncbi:MAG: N-acetylmuramoyl-L-alanine amidase family protein, partial [Clostridium sp.]
MKKTISLFIICLLVSLNLFNLVVKAENLEQQANQEKKIVICIDPGHQEKGDNKSEPISPGSGQRKARVSSGTAGVRTKKAEYIVNLEASMILKEILEAKGYNVVMTRETHNISISNAERAEVANKCNADLTIRIHCDSLNDSGKTGSTILVPSKNGQNTKSIFEASNKYAKILEKNLKASGIKVNGVFERSDITGFNWSQVPVVIFEM